MRTFLVFISLTGKCLGEIAQNQLQAVNMRYLLFRSRQLFYRVAMVLLAILGMGYHSVAPDDLTSELGDLGGMNFQTEYRHTGIESPSFVFERTDWGDFSGNELLSNSPRSGHPTLTASGAFENRGYALLMHE